MNLVNGLAHQASLVSQWLERPTSIWKAMGSIPVEDSDFFFVPRSRRIQTEFLRWVTTDTAIITKSSPLYTFASLKQNAILMTMSICLNNSLASLFCIQMLPRSFSERF